jgi:Mitochondrial biogenesis AIM24
MAIFEVIERENLRLVKVTLQNETVRTESGAMHYIRDNIQMESKAPSAGGFVNYPNLPSTVEVGASVITGECHYYRLSPKNRTYLPSYSRDG